MNRLSAVATVSLVLAGGVPLMGQSIETRVDNVRDGFVRMSFAARDGVCGNGRNFYTNRRRNDNWEPDCDTGPVMVLLERRSGETVDIDTYVGGRWRDVSNATDLGTVGAVDAARFFLTVARSQSRVAGDAVTPATLADSITVWPELGAMARDESLRKDVRKSAMFWTAQLGDDTVVDMLREIMRSEPDKDLREHAIFALSQHGSDRALATLRGAAEDSDEQDDVRKKAVFWLGQRGHDINFLINLYSRIDSHELKEHLLFVYSQRRGDDDALNKLIQVARDSQDRELQRKAIFWLGQTNHPRAIEFLAESIG